MNREEVVRAGHFTTMQVRGGRVQGWDLHLSRLAAASRQLYGKDPDKAMLVCRIRAAAAAAWPAAGDCTMRVRVQPPGGDPERIEVDIQPPRQPSGAPLRVRTHRGVRSCPSVKHLALDLQHDAREQARSAGFDDALLVTDDGRIAEGTFWNICFWDGAGVVWPDGPALEGVTQQLLARALDRGGVPQERRPITVDSLAGLVGAFALNSAGIAGIAAIDRHLFPGSPDAGGLLQRLLADVPWDPL